MIGKLLWLVPVVWMFLMYKSVTAGRKMRKAVNTADFYMYKRYYQLFFYPSLLFAMASGAIVSQLLKQYFES